MSKAHVLGEFWRFLREEKKYWLMPIILVFLLFGLLMVFSSSTPLAPFIYPLF
jgi:cell division protein FtsW (lipid II flippase)